jgi:hypothetical protein
MKKILLEKHNIKCIWILMHGACICNNSLNIWILQINKMESSFILIYSLNLVPKMNHLNIKIKFDVEIPEVNWIVLNFALMKHL